MSLIEALTILNIEYIHRCPKCDFLGLPRWEEDKDGIKKFCMNCGHYLKDKDIEDKDYEMQLF